MAIFQVTVQTSASQPVIGAGVRLINPDGVDITFTRFGASPVLTDASGTVSRFFAATGPDKLPSGVYTITASASGYTTASVQTSLLFTGTGSFVVELNPTPFDPQSGTGSNPVSTLDSSFVSPMAPVEVTIGGTDGLTGWEYIEATITGGSVTSSIMEVPVVNGSARINLQARLELEPLLQLISDADNGVIDGAFSDQLTVSLASLTAAGTRPLAGEFSVSVANVFPTRETNDLTNFTNIEGLAEWLTPWEELPKFMGHPADAAIWLPIPYVGPYALKIEYLNINRVALSQASVALPADLFALGKVVKIRIPEPIDGAHYASLTVMLSGIAQTKPLIVHYHNG